MAAIDRLTKIVMRDNHVADGDEVERLLTAAVSGMPDRRHAEDLVDEFWTTMRIIEISFTLDEDGGRYIDQDRQFCLSMLREIAEANPQADGLAH
ncbi:hypothetical protein [Pararhizobium mangrovi]|uniref:Uncharacterized protein n=1 Tax=Pararhizobium mangrovi TaxID=2590452 RepID=A0A506TZG6_9HYPH|nr:hypothetical protein [Pararhizobium mangrovi]TPW26134.1 hypothetical protein FJU11_16035 [Pararhizobium mangrovi]